MADIDTAAIRAEGDNLIGREYDNFASAWHEDLLGEVERLRARLAEVEAERDRTRRANGLLHSQVDALGDRLAEVEAERDLDRQRVEWSRKAEYNERARALAAEAKLAAVEAECGAVMLSPDTTVEKIKRILAVARGEGDQPAEAPHEFTPSAVAKDGECYFELGPVTRCGRYQDHPIHSGEGDHG